MHQGKQRKKSTKTKDKVLAKRVLNNFRRDLIAGKIIPLDSKRKKFFDFVNEFLDDIRLKKAQETVRLFSDALTKAKDCWGDVPLKKINTHLVDQYVRYLLNLELPNVTVNKHLRHLKAALRKAYYWDYIPKPVKVSFLPEEDNGELRPFRDEELEKFFTYVKKHDPEFADFCLFALNTGLRSGEIIRLTWNDIDNIKHPKQIYISSKRKNRTGFFIPVNEVVGKILTRCKKRKNGKKLFRFNTTNYVSQRFKFFIRKAGIPDHHRFHDLRHTFGTRLAEQSENPFIIQSLMGHKSLASSARYVHISNEAKRRASEEVAIDVYQKSG